MNNYYFPNDNINYYFLKLSERFFTFEINLYQNLDYITDSMII